MTIRITGELYVTGFIVESRNIPVQFEIFVLSEKARGRSFAQLNQEFISGNGDFSAIVNEVTIDALCFFFFTATENLWSFFLRNPAKRLPSRQSLLSGSPLTGPQ